MLAQELGKGTLLSTRGARVPHDEHTDFQKEEKQVSHPPFEPAEDKTPVTNSSEKKRGGGLLPPIIF